MHKISQIGKSTFRGKIWILVRCLARLKPDNFSKSKPEPDSTRNAHNQIESIGNRVTM